MTGPSGGQSRTFRDTRPSHSLEGGSDDDEDPAEDSAQWVDLVCSGSADRTVKVWHWPTSRCVQSLPLGKGVRALTQLKNGRLCVVCDENAWSLWNWVTGEREMTFEGHNNFVRSVVQLADGRVATGSLDNTLKLWK